MITRQEHFVLLKAAASEANVKYPWAWKRCWKESNLLCNFYKGSKRKVSTL